MINDRFFLQKGGEGRASEALRRFLVSSGGERGGWDERDHALFLQWRSRFRNNRQTFISAVCDTVPGININSYVHK